MVNGACDCAQGCEFNDSLNECVCSTQKSTHTSSCKMNIRTGRCKTRGCFKGSSEVLLPSGARKQMQDLQVGELVLTGSGQFLPILGWMDINRKLTTNFLKIRTNLSSSLSITGSHLIFTNSNEEEGYAPKFARDIHIGENLFHEETGNKAEILQILHETEDGFYSPLTASGTLIVDGYLVSCYASYPHYLAHAALLPARTWPAFFLGPAQEEGTGTFVTLVKTLGNFFNLRQN